MSKYKLIYDLESKKSPLNLITFLLNPFQMIHFSVVTYLLQFTKWIDYFLLYEKY